MKCFENILSILDYLPEPLIEPIWYPLMNEPIKPEEILERLGELIHELADIIIGTLKNEGFFDENPIIRIYPNYPEASGILVFHKGRKIFEKWLNTFEFSWNNKQEVARETVGWYEDMYQGMPPEEIDYFDDPPWEHMR